MTTIIQTGTKYDLYDSSIQTHQSLPAGIYRITFNPQSGHKLLYIADKNDIKEKIYGVHAKKVEKVLNTFRNFNRSEGVLLSGDNDFKLNVEKITYQFNTVRRGIVKPRDGEEIVTDKDKENAIITEITITNELKDF